MGRKTKNKTDKKQQTNELSVRKGSEMDYILLSGDLNMCMLDTDSKFQEGGCRKVIRIYFSVA